MAPPPAPPNEGSTQFVYLYPTSANYYLVDYSANTISIWNNITWLPTGGSLTRFLFVLKGLLRSSFLTTLAASNSEPAVTDYFGNTDNNMSAFSAPTIYRG